MRISIFGKKLLILTDDKLYFLTAGKDGNCKKELDLLYSQILFLTEEIHKKQHCFDSCAV